MKKYISITLLFVAVFSCKKQPEQLAPPPPRPPIPSGYITNVQAYLKNNLLDSDYSKVDFNNTVLSPQPGGWFLRLAILNKKMERDFVLLQTDSSGNCSQGKFIHIRRDSSNMKTFNGRISVASFQHIATTKKVTDNAVTTLSCGEAEESIEAEDACDIIPSYDCDDCLPEVVVVGYTGSGGEGGISYSDYISLSGLLNGSGSIATVSPSGTVGGGSAGGSASGIYSPIGIPANPGTTKPPPIIKSPDITINYESSVSKPGIDVSAFMKCFSSIPDAGAECSVTIYADLPVNDNPAYIFNILSGATGHCFLQLSKTNGSESVTQYFGFTTSKPLAVLGFPVAGKIVDNTGHKFNASLTMNITPAQLTTEINAVNAIGSNQQYDMWENNCVNYAVGILNKIRPNNPLNVGLSLDPSTDESYDTPQGLYIALNNLRNQNGPDAANITMDVVKNAGTSHGACTP